MEKVIRLHTVTCTLCKIGDTSLLGKLYPFVKELDTTKLSNRYPSIRKPIQLYHELSTLFSERVNTFIVKQVPFIKYAIRLCIATDTLRYERRYGFFVQDLRFCKKGYTPQLCRSYTLMKKAIHLDDAKETLQSRKTLHLYCRFYTL